MHFFRAQDTQLREPFHDVLAQDLENLRNRHKDRDAARMDLPDDLVGIETAHEDHDAWEHGRNEGRHGLAEHVAERQQVQETDREEGPPITAILQDFALHGNDVGEDVAVRDDDAFGFGGGTGGKDDLRGL